MTDLDLFCCAGGATTGLAMLGRTVVGVDHDPDACRTHMAAGHPTIRADLTATAPVSGPFDMVWASPPCTAFSMAGKGAGREVSDVLIGRILAENWEPMDLDPTVWLILPTMAALLELGPTAIAMENVPPTLPVMHACARVLERHGWHTAVGVLSAERFGVAQTRKRAFLIANRERRVQMPEPTHQGYGDEVDESQGALFGEPLLPWISMADALGWGCGLIVNTSAGWDFQGSPEISAERPARVVTGHDIGRWMVRTGANTMKHGREAHDIEPYERPVSSPAPVVDGKAGSAWKIAVQPDRPNAAERRTDQPAPSVAFGHNLPRDGAAWTWERPATALVSSFRPDVVAGPGYRQAGDGPRQDAPGSISISISEAARLQAFPNGHPWQGSRTSVFRQVGNAVPPPVAAAVAGAALGIDWRPAVADYLAELYSQPLDRERAA